MPELTEQELWKMFQDGDEEAYTKLYRLYIKNMYRYGSSLVAASDAFVMDCIHDVFTEMWIKRERLSVPVHVKYYLLKALKTRIIHLLERKERPFTPLSEIDAEIFDPDDFEILEELDMAVSRQDKLNVLIAKLPQRQQEAIKLRFIENLNYSQIAEILQMNTQSAKNLVFRAIEKLRGWIILPVLHFFNIFLG
ncbi:RNA polymerase sigma factor (sigma-70 family) [Dyadobacter sp. BE34]|uniref:RNA polymerase sigma factor (Sigma-70 family) n=1 Tax=Dyadobacter fermentans TaxID=94254 RepID=A0ABU1R0A9_9BACT|nr:MULTISPECIES: sigma-70 family RNA polymerase sigma factor [Dyadobacter]MDR6806847.1 RNA polymerase sigma factor (sigma-70 family) [Dyadobacter fermentans]MDR7044589.1 RNA polymerase sigma factor (sigma-70 family) [Dyadobacter sp. BE242]MDR7198899.1 RNA polymerase sigma factor (sigma-70 family) [Dyadobacter sp. BE34]MDR7216861.1 RNA polymerase sigma factor (sigma-70 family) [Dyadobacter sp. BE31]MDR7263613.1 RNA polymerase sigma factor (sigma-70 family) [Dyadobacter sp. BE32]